MMTNGIKPIKIPDDQGHLETTQVNKEKEHTCTCITLLCKPIFTTADDESEDTFST